MEWYRDLYLDGVGQKEAERMRKNAESGKRMRRGVFIVIGASGKHPLELIPAKEMQRPYVRENIRLVAGIANGRDGALRIAEKIVTEVYAGTGGFDFTEFGGARVS